MHRGPPDGRGLQPEGRRRDDDDRDQHRHRRGRRAGRTGSSWSTSPSSSAGSRRYLNLEPKQTLADVVRDEAALREPELLRTYAMRHDSGLHVLAAPAAPEAAETVTPAHVDADPRRPCSTATTWSSSTPARRSTSASLTIFEAAEAVILPVTPEIAALKAMHALLEYLSEAGSVGLKSTFVLNNLFAREILKLRDVESVPRLQDAVELPYDPFLYLKAVNEGVPIVTGAPRSTPAERLVKLSATAFGEEGYQIARRRRREEVGRAVPATQVAPSRA